MFRWLFGNKPQEPRQQNTVSRMEVLNGYLVTEGMFWFSRKGPGQDYYKFSVFGSPGSTFYYDTETGEQVWDYSLVRFINEQYQLRKFKAELRNFIPHVHSSS